MKRIGILTAGGDCPGINAAIRGVTLPLLSAGIEVVGFIDGFKGLVDNRTVDLDLPRISGVLTRGGTILGTSRVKPEKYPLPGGGKMDKTALAADTFNRLKLDGLVCIGGGGTQENSFRLTKRGIPRILTIPKTIDNDIAGTDVCFGYDSAMAIASEAIDRLHTTASSHHRCMIVDVMGNNAGWLALGAGVAGGADIILVPEWPFYQEELILALEKRRALGKLFSIVVVAEGAKPHESSLKEIVSPQISGAPQQLSSSLASFIQAELGFETRVTSLGHVQRGGSPTPRDRFLATLLGTKAAEEVLAERFGTMMAVKGEEAVPIPLEEVAGKKKILPLDHPWVTMARRIGISLGQ